MKVEQGQIVFLNFPFSDGSGAKVRPVVVLQMFKYEGYAKDPAGTFTKSKLVEVSNKVSYTVG